MAAAEFGNVSELQAALHDGADVRGTVRTVGSPTPLPPLAVAVIWKHYDAVEDLLNAGADPNSAIGFVACTAPDIIQLLLEHGANPNFAKRNSSGVLAGTVLKRSESDKAADRYAKADDRCYRSAELLIKYGANVNGIEGVPSPLFVSINWNSVRFAKLFLSSGANVNLVGDVGFPPLIEALRERVLQIACVREHGRTCLERGSDVPMIRLLLNRGANPNFRVSGRWMSYWDKRFQYNYLDGSTALCIAARYGLPKTAELLLEHGADPSIARSDGALPLAIARENTHVKTAAVIEGFIAKHGTGK